jgi:hypothetical protein
MGVVDEVCARLGRAFDETTAIQRASNLSSLSRSMMRPTKP